MYTDGDFCLRVGAKPVVPLLGEVAVNVAVTLKKVHGRVLLHIPPYPIAHFSLCFVEEPIVEAVTEVKVGQQAKDVPLPSLFQPFCI